MGLDIYSNSKNPYEIRLELLKVAHEIAERKYYQKQGRAEILYNALAAKCIEALDKAEGTDHAIYDYWKNQLDSIEFPTPPDAQEITEIAEDLKEFIDNKSDE